jgi:hypothetical protein
MQAWVGLAVILISTVPLCGAYVVAARGPVAGARPPLLASGLFQAWAGRCSVRPAAATPRWPRGGARSTTAVGVMSADSHRRIDISVAVRAPWSLDAEHPAAKHEKVAEIFRFLSANPVAVGGERMDYEPLEIMAKRTQRAFADSPAFDLLPEHLPGGRSDAERLKMLETTGSSAGDEAAGGDAPPPTPTHPAPYPPYPPLTMPPQPCAACCSWPAAGWTSVTIALRRCHGLMGRSSAALPLLVRRQEKTRLYCTVLCISAKANIR